MLLHVDRKLVPTFFVNTLYTIGFNKEKIITINICLQFLSTFDLKWSLVFIKSVTFLISAASALYSYTDISRYFQNGIILSYKFT